jgi:hypothetical protein
MGPWQKYRFHENHSVALVKRSVSLRLKPRGLPYWVSPHLPAFLCPTRQIIAVAGCDGHPVAGVCWVLTWLTPCEALPGVQPYLLSTTIRQSIFHRQGNPSLRETDLLKFTEEQGPDQQRPACGRTCGQCGLVVQSRDSGYNTCPSMSYGENSVGLWCEGLRVVPGWWLFGAGSL